jgi:hypothetical protein
MDITLCGIDRWDLSMELGDGVDCRFLAISTSKDSSEHITYIVKSTKQEKGIICMLVDNY